MAADDHELVAVELLDARALRMEPPCAAPPGSDRTPGAPPGCSRANGPPHGASRPARGRRARSRASARSRSRSPPGRQRRRQLRQLLVVEVGLELVDADHADDPVADDHRRADPAANACAALKSLAKCGLSETSAKTCVRFDRTTWLLRLVSSSRSNPPRASLEVVEPAPAHDHQAVSLDHLHRAAVIGHDPLQLVEDRLDRVLQAQCLPEHLRHRQQRLGVLPCELSLGDVVVDGEEADVGAFDR